MQYYNAPRPFSEWPRHTSSSSVIWFGYRPVLPRGFGICRRCCFVPRPDSCACRHSFGRGRRGLARCSLLTFRSPYFAFVSNQSLQFGRYLMPIVPMLSIGVASGIVTVHGALARIRHGPAQPHRARGAAARPAAAAPRRRSRSNANQGRQSTTEDRPGAGSPRTSKPKRRSSSKRRCSSRRGIPHERVYRLIVHPLAQYRSNGTVYLVASSAEYDKYFNDPNRFAREIADYNEICSSDRARHDVQPVGRTPRRNDKGHEAR